jgi:diphosphomevalonate decarboxylase
VKEFHKDFQKVRDAILVVDSGPKKISSSVGHALMENNPYANERFQQARDNLDILYTAMIEGNWQSFIVLMEEEALSLHAMMMTSRPGYLLLQPGTLSILQLIREFRKETGHKLGFTLDAGANVHLLYADADAERVEAFIRSELLSYCENGKVIWDRMGMGPEKSER